MSRRIERVSELLRQEISQLVARQIKDPRLRGVISITRVKTSSDLRAARVFLSVMGAPTVKQDALEGIRSAATFLRRELGRRLTLRHTPFLTFELDNSMEEANYLLGLMDSIQEGGPAGDPAKANDRHTGPAASPSAGG